MKVSYHIDTEKGIVVCIIRDCSYLLCDYIEQHSDLYLDWNKYEMPNTFAGIARCAPEDTFNLELGKKIAYHKAQLKVTNSFFKHARKFLATYDKQLNLLEDELNAYGNKLAIKADARENDIEEMLTEK